MDQDPASIKILGKSPEETPIDYPVLSHAEAQLSADGRALLVDAPTFDGAVVRFALAVPDIRNLIGFLLASLAGIGRSDPTAAEAIRRQAMPSAATPISSFSVSDGEDGDEALVVIGVGPTELAFSLPADAFDPIGRALLAASARPSSAGPS